MIQLKRATVVVIGSCENEWCHREEEKYSYQGHRDQELRLLAARCRAVARLKLDHFAWCACGTAIYETVSEVK